MKDREPLALRWRRLTGLIVKESRQVLRDPSSVLIAGVMPLLLLFLFGYGVTFDPRQLDVALVVEQQSSETASFQASLENSTLFEVETGPDRRLFERALTLGELDGLIVLQADFAEKAFRAEGAPIQVIVDGGDPNTAYLVSGYVELLWANWLEQEWISRGRPALAPSVQLEPQVWFNPEISSRNYLVPGSIAIILTTIGALLTALVVAREWERGTMEALLATPVGILELLIGKLVPYFLLGLGSMALAVITAVLLFGVPFRGSLAVLILSSSLFMLCSLGQGLLISTLTRNQLVAAQTSVLTAFLLGSASLTACSDPESRTPPASGPADQTRPEPFEQADEAMPGDTGRATGRITSLDRDDGRVTIDHGPFEGIAMGAMTMSFALMGDLELTDLSEGDDVIFQVKRGRDGSHRIMEICSIPANGRDCPDQETVYPHNPPDQ